MKDQASFDSQMAMGYICGDSGLSIPVSMDRYSKIEVLLTLLRVLQYEQFGNSQVNV